MDCLYCLKFYVIIYQLFNQNIKAIYMEVLYKLLCILMDNILIILLLLQFNRVDHCLK